MFYKFEKGNIHLERLLYVAAARNIKDQTKPLLMHLHSTGTQVVATDGHRCHVYTPEEGEEVLPAGNYEVIKATRTQLHLLSVEGQPEYPDFNRIIPETTNPIEFVWLGKRDTVSARLARLDKLDTVSSRLAKVLRAMEFNCVDFEFFKAAAELSLIHSYQVKGGNDPILFVGDGIKGIVMPERYDV